MYIINFENVNIGYDYRYLVLKNINLKIKEGENWVILGANGSGKSTLLKLMSNDLYANTYYKFKKEIFGKQVWDISELKKKLGIVTNDLHNDFVYNAQNSSAFEIIISGFYSSLGKMMHHTYSEEEIIKCNEIMNELNICTLKDKKAKEMSTGQLRKCLIARALIHKPKALLLDEPSAGLDMKAQNDFISLLRKISSKLSIIIITHHLEEVFEEITHVALICDNGIYKQGKKEEILSNENISKTFDINIKLKKTNNRYFIEEIL
ncbi:MAG: ATP-binding cassette domain-containing protein [Campylobacteraceae bacterium]|nr:ATP-binding cassette domain-containing protein [Campylobacteraceae bacterium]